MTSNHSPTIKPSVHHTPPEQLNPPKDQATENQVQTVEYQTSIFVGSLYTASDVTVNLDVNEDDPSNITNKLTVLCQNPRTQTDNAVIKREIILPSNADVKTLESYLDEGYLHFTCNVVSKQLKQSTSTSSLTTVTPQQTNSSNSSSNQLNYLNNHIKSVTLKSLNFGSESPDAEVQVTSVFENPLYSNSQLRIGEDIVRSAPKLLARDLSTNENVAGPMRMIKGIASNVARNELASNSFGRILDSECLHPVDPVSKGSHKNEREEEEEEEEEEEDELSRVQKGRSYSLPGNQKSVKFDIENNKFHKGMRSFFCN